MAKSRAFAYLPFVKIVVASSASTTHVRSTTAQHREQHGRGCSSITQTTRDMLTSWMSGEENGSFRIGAKKIVRRMSTKSSSGHRVRPVIEAAAAKDLKMMLAR